MFAHFACWWRSIFFKFDPYVIPSEGLFLAQQPPDSQFFFRVFFFNHNNDLMQHLFAVCLSNCPCIGFPIHFSHLSSISSTIKSLMSNLFLTSFITISGEFIMYSLNCLSPLLTESDIFLKPFPPRLWSTYTRSASDLG